jgi:phosphotriesterase-related protein
MSAELIIQTVTGVVAAAELGITLSHEHLLCDTRAVNFAEPADPADSAFARAAISIENVGWVQRNWANHLDNLVLDDEALAIEEVRRFRDLGGSALVDLTLPGIGRSPQALVRIASATGLNIVMGSGYYVARSHPPGVRELSEDELARCFIAEVRSGVGDTGIRAGVLGEIGATWPLDAEEARVLRAAGLAQTELKCGVSIHLGRHPDSPAQVLEVLRTSGVDLSRVVLGHIDRTVQTLDGLRALAESGCILEFDLFGLETTARHPYWADGIDMPSDAQRLDRISALVGLGYAEQILISHDVCTKHRLRRYGGLGYDHILRDIVPWMRLRGFAEQVIQTILVDNPRRVLAMPVTL